MGFIFVLKFVESPEIDAAINAYGERLSKKETQIHK
ncbi:hypothetical protein QG37_06450 [Candidozyma auris]|uniref:Uncharacterized protein n=1 Tax=Candidozyma auris TaxID=498019 RepID=A0A0L0NST1_CANAR|nr:hypothetical protein QG37_06450 [[Candida] auris]